MAQAMLAMTIMAALLVAHGVSAKRGCAAFGHSCFGGHGKRSAASAEVLDRSFNIVEPGDNLIPIRDGGMYDEAARDALNLQFRNIFKRWVSNYRRSQQNTDYTENV